MSPAKILSCQKWAVKAVVMQTNTWQLLACDMMGLNCKWIEKVTHEMCDISIWFLIFIIFFFTIFPFFINIQKKIWGQTLGALWLLYYINIYPVLSVYEKIPMGPPIFHEIWRSEFGGHLGSWQKGHYFNKKKSEIFHPI